MTLSPDQFNKLVTKDEFNELKDAVFAMEEKFDKRFDGLFTAIDAIAKQNKDAVAERASNIVAHDRFETRIGRVEKQIELNPIAG